MLVRQGFWGYTTVSDLHRPGLEVGADMQQVRVTFIAMAILALASCSFQPGGASRDTAVNKYLWNASLETLSFLPVEQADPFSGLIVTGWGRAEGSSQQYRATVLVQNDQLDAQSLKVAVFRRSGGREVPATIETATAVENAILFRARELRISDVRG